MSIWQLYDKYLPHRRYESIDEAAQMMQSVAEFGYGEKLIDDQTYLAAVILRWQVNPHVPVTFRLYRPNY
jgi:hypothetical protein